MATKASLTPRAGLAVIARGLSPRPELRSDVATLKAMIAFLRTGSRRYVASGDQRPGP